MVWQPPKAPRGVEDILPEAIPIWRRAETVSRDTCERYGYREIRVPIFESTDLYRRGMGEVTDVVEKEMFSVGGPPAGEGREAEAFSLRPEFTAGVVRAYREHGLDKSRGFMKVHSIGPLFRYERPQKGRCRQFHQVNIEALGSSSPTLDVEAMALARDIVLGLGIPGFRVRLNSIGHEAPECRARYRALLRERFGPRLGELCPLCRERFDRNIFRVLDCKRCADKTADAPPMAEHLCAPCAGHFSSVRSGLDRLAIPYAVDARLVRGFDYYTRTVFEFPSERLGAQDALGGGGRYDRLIPDMGGPEVGACGLALGVERLILAMTAGEAPGAAPARRPAVFVAALPDQRSRAAALDLAQALRSGGIESDVDHEARSLKSQFKLADRMGFTFVVTIGPDEVARAEAKLRDLRTGSEEQVGLRDLDSRVKRRIAESVQEKEDGFGGSKQPVGALG